MSGLGLLAASVIAIICGGYIGVAYDRYTRRPPYDRPRLWVESVRMEKLHVIDDDLYKKREEDEAADE